MFVFNSVRVRLTCWYVGVLSLVLIGFSIGVYTLLAAATRNDLDRELANSIDVLSRSLRHEIAEHEGKQPGEESFVTQVINTVYRDSFPGVSIAIYDGRRLVAAKPGPSGTVPFVQEVSTSDLAFTTIPYKAALQRVATQALSVDNAGNYQFVSMASLSPVEADLSNLRNTFYLAVPLALAGAAFGGFLLARKSLAPVVQMSETADRISSKDLSQRVAAGNPKDEMGRLAATLNRLLGRIEKSFVSQRQFMEDSSHELRTPVYVAQTAAQVMLEREGRPEAEYREALLTVDQQMKRLQHLVDDLFVLARADSGTYPLRIADFDLGETIHETVRAAKLLGDRRGVAVTGPVAAELPCHADEGLIRQLLMILLDNAVKYTPSGGRVVLDVQESPTSYVIAVRDTGPGIPREAQDRVFDRFYRADKARLHGPTEIGGSGLGLAIAKWIAAVHGGVLKLKETGPGGTCFEVALPLTGNS